MTVEPQIAVRNVADRVLQDAGFVTREERLEAADLEWLLAENDLFMLALVVGTDLKDLQRLESLVAPELTKRMSSALQSAKRWDAYLVLLGTGDPRKTAGSREVFDIQHDTRGVRRILTLGVDAADGDLTDVSKALQPFLPLPVSADAGIGDALASLVEHLVVNGVEHREAQRMVASFAERGDLDAV